MLEPGVGDGGTRRGPSSSRRLSSPTRTRSASDVALPQKCRDDRVEVVDAQPRRQPVGGAKGAVDGFAVLELPLVADAAAAPQDRRHGVALDVGAVDDPAQRRADQKHQKHQASDADAEESPQGTAFGRAHGLGSRRGGGFRCLDPNTSPTCKRGRIFEFAEAVPSLARRACIRIRAGGGRASPARIISSQSIRRQSSGLT